MKKPIYTVTYEQIEGYVKKGYEQGKKDAIKTASEYSMAVPMIILRDTFGFGKKRLLKYHDAFLDMYDSISRGYLNLRDIVQTIKEETGVEIIERNRK